MKTKLTYLHIGLGEGSEIGVQFETIDDADQPTSTQRAFVVLDAATLAPVWAAARAALDAELDGLPLDFPPPMVTTALMQKREALAGANKAAERKVADEQAAQRAQAEAEAAANAKAEAERAWQTAEAAKAILNIQIAAKRAELDALAAAIADAKSKEQ